jgi:hypothetical protein
VSLKQGIQPILHQNISTFYTSQRLSEGEHLDSSQELRRLFEATLYQEGNHSAETSHLFFGDLMLGMGLETWIDDPLDERMLLEEMSQSVTITADLHGPHF